MYLTSALLITSKWLRSIMGKLCSVWDPSRLTEVDWEWIIVSQTYCANSQNIMCVVQILKILCVLGKFSNIMCVVQILNILCVLGIFWKYYVFCPNSQNIMCVGQIFKYSVCCANSQNIVCVVQIFKILCVLCKFSKYYVCCANSQNIMCFVQILIVCVVQRDWLSELPNAALLLQIPTEGAEIPPARLQTAKQCKTVQWLRARWKIPKFPILLIWSCPPFPSECFPLPPEEGKEGGRCPIQQLPELGPSWELASAFEQLRLCPERVAAGCEGFHLCALCLLVAIASVVAPGGQLEAARPADCSLPNLLIRLSAARPAALQWGGALTPPGWGCGGDRGGARGPDKGSCGCR